MRDCFNAVELNKEYTIRLNEIADSNRTSYTEFIDSYSRLYGNNDMWWATLLSGRNNAADDMFYNLCLFLLCKEIVETKKIKSIIVPNNAVKKTLQHYCKNSNYKIRIISKEKKKKIFLNFFFTLLVSVIDYSKAHFAIKRTRYQYSSAEPVTLIAESVLSSYIRDNRYFDRYFTNIKQYTNEKIVYLADLSNNTSMKWSEFIKLLICDKNFDFIFRNQYIKLRDYVNIIKFYLYCSSLSKKTYTYLTYDISAIAGISIMESVVCMPSLKGVLANEWVKRLKDSNLKIKNFIVWYEGRPSDVMLCKAFRTYFPDVNCIGYEGFPLSEQWNSLYISEEQYRQKSCPSKIAVGGSFYKKLARQFCNELDVIVAPILRTEYFPRNSVQLKNDNRINIILVLSYFCETSYMIIDILNQYVYLSNDDNLNVYVKNHPVFSGKTLDFYYKDKIYFEPHYLDGDLIDCLKDMDIAFTGKSSSSMEIIYQGVYLIELFELNKIKETYVPFFTCNIPYNLIYDIEDFTKAITNYKQRDKSKAFKLDNLFEKTTTETVARMW